MSVPFVLLAACLLPLAAPYGVAHADPVEPADYCGIPDDFVDAALLDPIAWIQPVPAPTAAEPTVEQRARFAGFPSVASIDLVGKDGRPVRKVIASWSTNVDEVMEHTGELAVSHDDGDTFGVPRAAPLREAPLQLLDGRLLATRYYLSPVDPHTSGLDVLTSTDAGETWTRSTATFTTPDELAGIGVAHGTPIQLLDGTILVAAYNPYGPTAAFKAEVYASRDGGRTFTRRGVIAEPSDGFTYNEAAIEQVADGSLLAVLRRDGGLYSTLHYSRSADGGVTWSPVDQLRLPGQDCVVRGVSPRLLLMPNGVLVLSAGRPDNWMTVSLDGRGDSWGLPRVTYHNRDGVYDSHGSSGYTGIAPIGVHRLVQVFDNCKLPGKWPDGTLNETACPAGGKFEHGGWYAIKRRRFDVIPPDPGRIDLAAKARRGELTVTTNMTWSAAEHPRARPGGAHDGSTGYWSSAVARGRGVYVVHFDSAYTFTDVGLSLRPGHAADAKVYVSRDGRNWGSPVATVTGRVDYALRYSPLPPEARGRHVKIVLGPTRDCDPEVGRLCSMLNELELYAATPGATAASEPAGLTPGAPPVPADLKPPHPPAE
ncbi:exo-alpha-sialidase [Nonomuraea jiangxiensis]|uniref:F5/8 type C domain-containing protein n=1 Tax=Nonomuraea jiangxiensis TaxID=633440 RepID=A0A1G8DHL5_9ACTN|nr:exo-alpha-sialidase [Nonomuraea jiangxiensis]SDH57133.1 F5/8 type C domain-containing protein [Nonomuraea jiangxiensis]